MIKENKHLFIFVSVIVAFVAVLILVLVMFFNEQKANRSESIVISNFNKYIKNIPKSERVAIEKSLYTTVIGNVEKPDPKSINSIDDAFIRDGSYSQDYKDKVYSTAFIVDIASIKQSYRVTNLYSPIGKEEAELYDYTILVLCLGKGELKFGEFKCQDRITQENGFEEYDPIIGLIPYSTLNYTINRNFKSEKLQLLVKLYLSEVDRRMGVQESIDYYKEQIKAWFESNKLNIEDYDIVYEY